MAIWLSFPAAGTASLHQDPAGSANASGQAQAAPSPRESVPAESASAQKAPTEATPPAPANPQAPAAEQKVSERAAKEKSIAGAASGAGKHRQRTAPAPGAPQKIVVREGGASEPAAQIEPGITPAEAARQHQDAERWLSSADDQLKRLAARTLNARQQETVGQIRNYMDGARSALNEGDARRASTLAQKAHLLAEDLAKH